MRVQKLVGGLVAFAFATASTVVLTPVQALADQPLPANLVDQLKAAGADLVGISALDQLGETIPGFGTNPSNLLGLHEPFSKLSALTAATEETLESEINGLDGEGFVFDGAAVTIGSPKTTVSFKLSAARTVDVPLLIATDDVQVAGVDLQATVSMAETTFNFEFDTSVGGPADAFALVAPLPTLAVGATIAGSVNHAVQFGFADANASGTANLDTNVNVALVDPDGSGRLTGAEFATNDVVDVTDMTFPASPPDDVDIDLTLTASVAGVSFGGTLSVTDANLFDDPAPSIDVTPSGTNPIDLLSNLTPETAITSLTQLVSSIGAAMTGGDLKLPFLGDGVFVPGDLGVGDQADFDRVFDAIRPILDYVEPLAAGQIVCGSLLTTSPGGGADGLPAGSVRDVKTGDTVYCRAFTASNGSSINWTAANATLTSDAATVAASVGTAPTRNVAFTMTADDEFDVSVTYTPTGGDPTTIEQRPDTIQELAAELDAAGLIDDATDLEYNASLKSFELPIGTTVAGFTRDVTVDAGSSLVADTGLTGLSAAVGGAGAQIEVSDIAAGVTLGLIATEDEADINPADNGTVPPGPGDRFYIKTDGPIISVETVELNGNISMVGRLGFLEVAAEASGTLARPDNSANALEVNLADDGSVTVGGNTDTEAILVRDLLSGLDLDSFEPDVNLRFDGSIGVSASLPGNAVGLEGSIDVEWDLSNPNHPLLDPQLDFRESLLPFGGNETLTHAGGPNADETVFTASGGLLSNPGLVGAQLIDPATGSTCNITSIISDTTLRCENPAPDDGDDSTLVDQNPITFADGISYDVAGNTLAYLADILEAIERLATYLEEQVGDGEFAEPLPVIDVTPAEIVDQIGELRRMVDEFRGVQDANITCTVNDDPTIDPRAIPIANPGDTATLKCHAANSSAGVSGVRWRVNGDAQNGTFVNANADTVGAGTGTVTLTVKAPATDHDGFVSLGTEYTVEVEWTESAETHTASYPPRTPRSLQHLADLISEALDLPDGVLEFSLENPTDPATRTLRIDIGYGICSDPAPTGTTECEGMPTADAPTANLNFDLGGSLPPLVGLETTGTIAVKFAALGQFNIGIPLNGNTPVLYAGTGLEARLEVTGTNLGITASLGPVSASLGPDAGGATGTVTAESTTQLTDDTKDFTSVADAVPVGAVVTNTSTGQECTVTAVNTTTLDCATDWEDGNGYEVGGHTELEGAIGFELQVADGGVALTGDQSVAIDAADVVFTPFDTFLAGDADCADIGTLADEVVSDSDGDDSGLEGIICGRFSMELGLGSASLYLGELGLDLDDGGLTIYVPNDLETQILNAALNPAFLIQALPGLLKTVEDGMRSAADSGAPAPIADPLRAGADGIGVIRGGVESVIETFGDSLSAIGDMGDLGPAVDSELTALLQGLLPPELGLDVEVEVTTDCGGDCAGQGPLALQDIRAQVTIGQEVVVGEGINLGLEGLPISIDGGIEAFADWHVTAGIGVSRADGPYLDVSAASEVGVTAGVRLLELPDPPPAACTGPIALSAQDENWAPRHCLNGRLVFLFITAIDNADNPSNITATLGFDVTNGPDDRVTLSNLGGIDIDFTLEGTVHLDLAIRTGIGDGSPDFPSVLGRFTLDWTVAVGQDIPAPTIGFSDLHLDLGTFITGFLDPIVNEVKKITGPLQPIIDVLMAPIPVVSDLAELVGSDPITMISLLEAATGADLSLVKAMAAFITFVNKVGSLDGSLQIPLGPANSPRVAGAFNIDATKAAKSVASNEAGSLIKQGPGSGYTGGSGFANDIASSSGGGLQGTGSTDGRPSTFGVPGLSFPFLEDASQIFGILVGRDATLIRWDAGTLEAKAGFSYDFGPIMVGPVPITITIGGEVGVRGRFAIGYDTSGIRQVLDGGSGVALFDGIFIDDLDAAGNDVPEITFFGKVFAGASVDLVIISAGVRGGIELTFSLDLDDRPDPDGKLRILEIVDKLQNPICLFVVSGKIEAFLEAFVKIDLFFFTEEFSFELVRVTLLEWSSACEPPEPNLTDGDGTEILYLKTGARTPGRNIAEDQIDDKIEVRQIGDGVVRVSGFGWEEVHRGVKLIVADGGAGSDEFLFLAGTKEGTDGIPDTPETPEDAEQVPFTIPVVVSGGPGADIIKTGEAADKIHGDNHEGTASWAGFDYTAPTNQAPDADDTDHGDKINASFGNDLVRGGDGNDAVEGEFGADTILGQGGDDELKGGPGPDAIDGGGGNDTVQGGPIKQPTGPDADDDDALVGGDARDVISGDFGDDVIFGDNAFTGFFVDGGDGRYTFSAPSLATWTDDWCPDTGGGTPGDDILTGTDGADTIVGGAGNDKIDGDNGDDLLCGGPDNDEVVGDVGGDHLRGDSGDDLLTGNDGDDLIYGGADNDTATGDNGDDDMFGDTGSDNFSGNAGDDVVVGDGGWVVSRNVDGIATDGDIDPAKVDAVDNNTTRDGSGTGARRESCFATQGDSDCLSGGTGSDALFGGSDGDFLFGESGVDLLEGNAGDDELRGGTEDDLLLGSAGSDDIYGDSGDDQAVGDRTIDEWIANTPSDGSPDDIFGGNDADHLEGDGGGDTILAGAADDHVEGNDGDDTIYGEGGNDDLIGGSDTANVDDVGEALVSGGVGQDIIAGDNAIITKGGGYVLGRTVTLLDVAIGGGDTIEGDADTDAIFGEVGDDTIWGDQGVTGPFLGTGAPDYAEGDDGDDTIHGETGGDDIVGGGSAGGDGVVDADRDGTALDDGGETLLDGGPGRDWIAGDNARMDRVLGNGIDYPGPGVTPIVLFDLSKTGAPADTDAFGADNVSGGTESDLIFGQGGNDDDLAGDAGTDYIEGNDGDDTIHGGGDNDDLIGGGSASDGVIDQVRDGNTLWDGGETLISGGDGVDFIAGDNAFMNRVLFPLDTSAIKLFDVNSGDIDVSGGDTVHGDADDDLIFGQGNGNQGAQSDPSDGADNDGDGVVDEDGGGAWLGDELFGDAGQDYVEGNHGSDLIRGGTENDDLIGGGSADDGIIDLDRVGNGLNDARDTIHGDEHDDVVAGDNTRILPAASGPLWLTDARAVVLFDINSANAALSGGDYLAGEVGADVLFGQGNGSQPATQADPLDGYDNDLDGRESAASAEFDCLDTWDNDADTLLDGADPQCVAAIDEDVPWQGDLILGGDGIDYAEGNHGADWIFGDNDQDDLIGGGSALDGVIDADRSGVGLNDGPDVIHGNASHDVIAGDNATINKVIASGQWALIANGAGSNFPLLQRNVAMATSAEAAGKFGNDHLLGDDGHDQLYGQQGHDLIEGNAGDDGVIGDLGKFVSSVETGSRAAHIAPKQPFIQDDIFAAGTLTHLTTLYVQQTGQGSEGNDIVLGGQGHDDLHGGPGNDIMNGDLYAPTDTLHDVNLLLQSATPGQWQFDNDAGARALPYADEDAMFGGYGNDVMWGGRGPDQLYGGHGNDSLDVRPRPATNAFGQDPPSWFTWTNVNGVQESYQDSDLIYGGWGADVMQANLAGNGPQDGDRLFDWVGVYNLYYICASTYGDWVATRALAPGVLEFFERLALGDGLDNPAQNNSSGYLELGLVYTKDVKSNSNPPHPETPGHFYCGDGFPTP